MYGLPQHTKHSVIQELCTNKEWIEHALLLLYSYQTEEEKEEGVTSEDNGKGFNYNDGLIFSQYALVLLANKSLTDYQLDVCKQKIPKYWKQILNYIQSNPNHPFK